MNLPPFLLAGLVFPAGLGAGPLTGLYDPEVRTLATSLSESPTDHGWFPVASVPENQDYFHSPGDGVTLFDSFPVEEGGAWTTIGLFTGDILHPDSQVHDSDAGFTLHFDLAIDDENHASGVDIDGDGLADEAGFTVLILDSNAVGVAINFWEDRIWTSGNDYVSNSDPLAQAEFVAQDPAEMATLRSYALTVMRGAYRLSVNGEPILEGPSRSYDFFTLLINPFNKPNIINIGDASLTCGARGRVGAIKIETCFAPPSPPVLEINSSDSGIGLNWDTVPGASYTLQARPAMGPWSDLQTIGADSFSSVFFEPFPTDPTARLYRVMETLP